MRSGEQCCGAGAGRSRYFFGRSRCKDVKAKTCFLLLFSLFLYEEEPEPVKKSTWSRSRSKVDRLRNTGGEDPEFTSGKVLARSVPGRCYRILRHGTYFYFVYSSKYNLKDFKIDVVVENFNNN